METCCHTYYTYDQTKIPLHEAPLGPCRFPGIAGNAENYGNDGKFHNSYQTLNQF